MSGMHEAKNSATTMDHLDTAFLRHPYNTIIVHFNNTSKALQPSDVDLKMAVELMSSLKHF